METLALEVLGWLHEAKENLVEKMKNPLNVETKSAFNDLVTNLDKQTQQILMKKIKTRFPEDKILGEEDGFNHVDNLKGRVWAIDPIDGTLNFVLQQENFCIMVGLLEDGKPKLGFIYEVAKDELYWGGPSIGVYCNQTPLKKPADRKLKEGLLGTNAFMYQHNTLHTAEIADETMGIRVLGCAGVEMIQIITGKQVGYISFLQPWDCAAGCALLDAFQIPYRTMTGDKVDFTSRVRFIAMQPTAFEEVSKKYFSK